LVSTQCSVRYFVLSAFYLVEVLLAIGTSESVPKSEDRSIGSIHFSDVVQVEFFLAAVSRVNIEVVLLQN